MPVPGNQKDQAVAAVDSGFSCVDFQVPGTGPGVTHSVDIVTVITVSCIGVSHLLQQYSNDEPLALM